VFDEIVWLKIQKSHWLQAISLQMTTRSTSVAMFIAGKILSKNLMSLNKLNLWNLEHEMRKKLQYLFKNNSIEIYVS
jgi:hypothetical protein